MGGSKIGLDTTYKQAKSIAFELQDVLEDKVCSPSSTGTSARPTSTRTRYVAELLESDEVYVTMATIKSKKFVVEAKDSATSSLAVQVPVIQQVVGGNVQVSLQSGSTSKVVYEPLFRVTRTNSSANSAQQNRTVVIAHFHQTAYVTVKAGR